MCIDVVLIRQSGKFLDLNEVRRSAINTVVVEQRAVNGFDIRQCF